MIWKETNMYCLCKQNKKQTKPPSITNQAKKKKLRQFQIFTGIKYEDLEERGRRFFLKLSLICCFIWYLERIKLGFPGLLI